jgi:hypothetical protein
LETSWNSTAVSPVIYVSTFSLSFLLFRYAISRRKIPATRITIPATSNEGRGILFSASSASRIGVMTADVGVLVGATDVWVGMDVREDEGEGVVVFVGTRVVVVSDGTSV